MENAKMCGLNAHTREDRRKRVFIIVVSAYDYDLLWNFSSSFPDPNFSLGRSSSEMWEWDLWKFHCENEWSGKWIRMKNHFKNSSANISPSSGREYFQLQLDYLSRWKTLLWLRWWGIFIEYRVCERVHMEEKLPRGRRDDDDVKVKMETFIHFFSFPALESRYIRTSWRGRQSHLHLAVCPATASFMSSASQFELLMKWTWMSI